MLDSRTRLAIDLLGGTVGGTTTKRGSSLETASVQFSTPRTTGRPNGNK